MGPIIGNVTALSDSGGVQDFFIIFFAAWRSVLGQNLLKIRNFHKIRGDLFLIKSRKNLKLKMGLLGFLGDVCRIF